MQIQLIRHTTPAVGKGICYGQTDLAVTSSFESEADQVCHTISPVAEVIYTSPLVRCAQLASHLSEKLSIPVIADRRLMEMNFGEWEMKAWNDIEEGALQVWMDDYENERCPSGESYDDLVQRVTLFLEDLKSKSYQSVIIVTHAGVIKSCHAILAGMSMKEAIGVKVPYGGVLKIDIRPHS